MPCQCQRTGVSSKLHSLVNMSLNRKKKTNPNYNLDLYLYRSQSASHNICTILTNQALRRARVTIVEKDAAAQAAEEARREQEAEERRKQSHDMVADSIRRELAASMFNAIVVLIVQYLTV